MSFTKTKMPELLPEERNKNFNEVACGYTKEMAINEAKRCLNCKNKPCVAGCPVNVQIPDFIKAVAEAQFEDAYKIIKTTNALPAICGRVCPQENQCEKLCVRSKKGESVAIGRLERFAADYCMSNCESKPEKILPNGIKVAVIGSGPSGLTCAGDLAKLGYDVTVFEAFHEAGGVLVYGIPEFRLPKEIVRKEVAQLKELGVKIMLNMVIGKVLTIDELFDDGYRAIFIGTGAGLPIFMKIPGESLVGVYSANEYLTRANLMRAYDENYDTPIRKSRAVAVVGGGNVAMDAARCAKRLGAQTVYVVYRRSENEMPARAEEVHHAKEEGIIFKTLCNPIKVIGDENSRAVGLECIEMELGEPDASGRAYPTEKKGSTFVLNVDCVIMAIGTSPNPMMKNTTSNLNVSRKGHILTGDDMKTNLNGVYAGGDAVSGAATVINAMGNGKVASAAIDKYLKG